MKTCNHNMVQLCKELKYLFLCKNCGEYFQIDGNNIINLGRDVPEELIDKTMLICIDTKSKEFCDRGESCRYCKLADETNHENCQGESVRNWYDLSAPDW